MRPGSERTKPFAQMRFEELPERPRLSHRYFEGETATVVVPSRPFGEIATHVVSYGPRDAPPLLLIHGLMTTSYSWRYLFERLGDRFRLVAPDLPGAGRSAVPATGRRYTGAALATFVGELQDALGLAGCLTVGNSLGGYLCMRAALDDPATLRAPGGDPPAGAARAAAGRVARRDPGARRAGRPGARRPPRSAALGAQERPLLRRVAEVARGGARVRRPAGERGGRRRVRRLPRRLAGSARAAGVRARAAPPARQRRRLPGPAHARLRARGPDRAAEGRAPAAGRSSPTPSFTGWSAPRTSSTSTPPTASPRC